MRELTYVARHTVEWREAPDPALRSDREAIVAPVAATSCDVDSSILAGHGFLDPPFALGHECVARVVEIGEQVTTVAPGGFERVLWPQRNESSGPDRRSSGTAVNESIGPTWADAGERRARLSFWPRCQEADTWCCTRSLGNVDESRQHWRMSAVVG